MKRRCPKTKGVRKHRVINDVTRTLTIVYTYVHLPEGDKGAFRVLTSHPRGNLRGVLHPLELLVLHEKHGLIDTCTHVLV